MGTIIESKAPRMTVSVLGRDIGISSGWTSPEESVYDFIDFTPTLGIIVHHFPRTPFVRKTLRVDFQDGWMGYLTDKGEYEDKRDILITMRTLEERADGEQAFLSVIALNTLLGMGSRIEVVNGKTIIHDFRPNSLWQGGQKGISATIDYERDDLRIETRKGSNVIYRLSSVTLEIERLTQNELTSQEQNASLS